VQQAVRLIGDAGLRALTEPATGAMADLRVAQCADAAALAKAVGLLLVFGGDGTMLRAARAAAAAQTPVFGINVGGLGFLTAVSSRALADALPGVLSGEFSLESRAMIVARRTGRAPPIRQVALNDFVISRGPVSRLIELEVRVDGLVLTRYRGDGLIVSTPTGSTAYSLAAGGAVVSPKAEVFTLTPICPHTLSNRSVIVSLRSIVQVKVLSQKPDTILSADGQVHSELATGDMLTIRRCRQQVRFARLKGTSFFDTLREKMHWSGSSV
jgi:NAD+ kinase